ncbi:MAG: hypothetical protein PUE08_06535, partial [Eubacteriales bacterium]|nr:hypothetical protein [Eubacteriales bacterium]
EITDFDAWKTGAGKIDAKGHTVVTDSAVPATCTVNGLTEGSHCSVCGTVIVEQQVIPATGHTIVTDSAVPTTCTANGLTEGSHCSVCGTVIVEQQVVPAKGHTVVTDSAVTATCTANGLTEGSHCSVCGQVITAQQVIPATGHNFGNNQLNCSACGVTNPNYVAPQTTTKKPTAPSGAKKVDGVFVNSKYKKPTISKLSKGKKQIKVSWKKVSSVSGYQIQYSTSKKFTKKTTKSATISGN